LRIPARWVLNDLDSAIAAIRSDLAEHSPTGPSGRLPHRGRVYGFQALPL
jgi:hypothetical protein